MLCQPPDTVKKSEAKEFGGTISSLDKDLFDLTQIQKEKRHTLNMQIRMVTLSLCPSYHPPNS